ncbi:MAG TPA: hypothetical protein VFM71_09090 [Gemmatimonadaceae bacterium]|nr:hypothetical protein [Gemmatimonadaceae bacterium]
MTAMKMIRATASVLLAALVLGACSDDGPTFPTSFEPIELQNDLGVASAAANAPAAASFAVLGIDIETALLNAGGGAALMLEAPALLIEGPLTPTAELQARVERQLVARRTDVQMADALPAEVLGTTFVWDVSTSQYIASDATGAPANGVRFALYAINPLTDLPAEPLNEIGHVDITVTGGGDNATVRVQVWSEGVSATRVLDYSAHMEASQSSASVEIAGYAKNAQDSLAFTLSTGTTIDMDAVTIDWRTSLPSRGLVTRLIETLSIGEVSQFTIDAAIVSPSGRVDLDGTITDFEGGTLAVKVNGQPFATMTLSSSEDVEPVILNANNEPLTAEEEETLEQIFDWFSDAIEVFITLLAPVGVMLEPAVT